MLSRKEQKKELFFQFQNIIQEKLKPINKSKRDDNLPLGFIQLIERNSNYLSAFLTLMILLT